MYVHGYGFFLASTMPTTNPIVSSSVSLTFPAPSPTQETKEEKLEKEQKGWMNQPMVIGVGIGGGLMSVLVLVIIIRIGLRQHRLVSSHFWETFTNISDREFKLVNTLTGFCYNFESLSSPSLAFLFLWFLPHSLGYTGLPFRLGWRGRKTGGAVYDRDCITPGVLSDEVRREIMGDARGNCLLPDEYVVLATVMCTILLYREGRLVYQSFRSTQGITSSGLFVIMFAVDTRANGAQKALTNQLLVSLTSGNFSQIVLIVVTFNIIFVKRTKTGRFSKMDYEALIIFRSSRH